MLWSSKVVNIECLKACPESRDAICCQKKSCRRGAEKWSVHLPLHRRDLGGSFLHLASSPASFRLPSPHPPFPLSTSAVWSTQSGPCILVTLIVRGISFFSHPLAITLLNERRRPSTHRPHRPSSVAPVHHYAHGLAILKSDILLRVRRRRRAESMNRHYRPTY